MSKFGFIGTGNMGSALARAVAKAVPGNDILLANRTEEKAKVLAEELGARVVTNREIATEADYIFIGVKPVQLKDLFDEIGALFVMNSNAVIITMAGGISIEKFKEMANCVNPVIRIMPNTPSSIGEGIILYTAGEYVTEEQLETFKKGLAPAGVLSPLPERLMDAATSVTGCGPAFVDLFIEALADGAVACGVPRSQALEYAAQMTAGAARLVLESGKHPAQLKDEVCSPGGTTIEGVAALEQGAFRAAVMNAVIASYKANNKFK